MGKITRKSTYMRDNRHNGQRRLVAFQQGLNRSEML